MECMLRQADYCGIPPRNFAGLMELYESNYIRLRNLVPDLDALQPEVVSRVADALDLHLRIMERSKFTTTLNLTYHFSDAEGIFPAPDIRVRIYHDAQVGEVLACGRRRGLRHAEYNRMYHRYSLEEKWRMNRFLQKWLGYCLRQGHSFAPHRHMAQSPETTLFVKNSLLIAES
ncbi:MAG: DUF1249 domain-containing protein [Gammaproteobacteria bacterium]|nr:MAG: DUF1249 domain-containing protein [Gammaproteobacteria bacterium]